MSRKGIEKVAKIFSLMQETREELLRNATSRKNIDKQDTALAQMLDTGKDAMKESFAKITVMKTK